MSRSSRSSRSPLLAALALPVVLLACGETAPAPTASSSPTGTEATVSPALTPVPNGSGDLVAPTATPAAVSQTDTEWGRIWDALPDAFPRYPGSVPTETGEFGGVSAEFAVPDDAGTVATWLQASLEGAGYSTEALSGPLEDGSRVIESVGADGCRVETTVRPLGGTTHVAVRFGAACPFE